MWKVNITYLLIFYKYYLIILQKNNIFKYENYLEKKYKYNINDTCSFFDIQLNIKELININNSLVTKYSYDLFKNIINNINNPSNIISYSLINTTFLKSKEFKDLDYNWIVILKSIIGIDNFNKFKEKVIFTTSFIQKIILLLEAQIFISKSLKEITEWLRNSVLISDLIDWVTQFKRDYNLLDKDILQDKELSKKYIYYKLEKLWFNEIKNQEIITYNILEKKIKFNFVFENIDIFKDLNSIKKEDLSEKDYIDLSNYFILLEDYKVFQYLELIPNLEKYINNIPNFLINLKDSDFTQNCFLTNSTVLDYLSNTINYNKDCISFILDFLKRKWNITYFLKNLNFISKISNISREEILFKIIKSDKYDILFLLEDYNNYSIVTFIKKIQLLNIKIIDTKTIINTIINTFDFFKNKYHILKNKQIQNINQSNYYIYYEML